MKKIGILGGGQLGRMLLQAAVNYPVETFVMENDPEAPAAHLCHHFIKGDITRHEDVYAFGKNLDALTIEIEHVNTDALEKLEMEGVKIYPNVRTLKLIKNKIYQKEFYREHQIPTSDFVVTENREALRLYNDFFPAVHKLANGGYDGRGVQIINSENEIEKCFDAPAVLEKKIDIRQEISVIIAVGNAGETVIYPPVDMVFDQNLNLLSYQISPAELPEKVFWKVEAIALSVIKKLQSPGIFAIEMFSDAEENVYVNEIAPRVHNSGHHTIEGNYSSQFDMLWRVMLDYPLGNTQTILPSALVNLIGEEGHKGVAVYDGLHQVLSMENTFVHLYGKKETRPGRKMGHVTILSSEKQDLLYKANKIRRTLRVLNV
ncbi:MAG: 5-(carboxyamino)imidazole ribonucleotide synthase [Ferruginibacter sp.]|nr:5-(carboxyamino)imidazole ribonucleotide synthase [Ferruginibacter sp.]